MKSLLLASALTVASLSAAQAKDWYIYNSVKDVCEKAPYSPAQIIKDDDASERKHMQPGKKITYKIARDNEGNVGAVFIFIPYKGTPATFLMAPDLQHCNEARGTIKQLSELDELK